MLSLPKSIIRYLRVLRTTVFAYITNAISKYFSGVCSLTRDIAHQWHQLSRTIQAADPWMIPHAGS